MTQVTCDGQTYQVPETVAKELLSLRRLELEVRTLGLAHCQRLPVIHRQGLELALLMLDIARNPG